jgi:hypothetical protein
MTDPNLLVASEYDWNADDLDGIYYANDELLEEFADLSEFYRSFSFHRVNGDNPFDYGQDACKEILWDR